ncbi:Hypothetical protein ETEE_0571 [Edwardsiella anguillarum ET080813]|uniref:Uncharacterized protein n=1 Tax=Edwardsiella anguillarum ET080813 TaxID=667120 RepID=A0A076LEV9_9GAMM|nr:Hypothetical protein ETEE_0571 [Edwardsiella anguillarum ET080813]
MSTGNIFCTISILSSNKYGRFLIVNKPIFLSQLNMNTWIKTILLGDASN